MRPNDESPRPEIMALIQQAAAVEREACAQIAEETGEHLRLSPGLHELANVADTIAARIRARNAPC